MLFENALLEKRRGSVHSHYGWIQYRSQRWMSCQRNDIVYRLEQNERQGSRTKLKHLRVKQDPKLELRYHCE